MRKYVRVFAVIGSVVAATVVSSAALADDPAGGQMPAPAASPNAPAPPAPRNTPPASGTATKPPAPGTQQTAPTPPQQGEKAASEAGGIVQMIDGALSGINLRPEQKDALKDLGKDADGKAAAVDQAKRDELLALADQIEAGKVDASALHDKTEAFTKAADAASPTLRKDLEKIHDTLDPDQRKQFVTAFRDELKKAKDEMDEKKNEKELADELKLTDDQKKKIDAIFDEEETSNQVDKDRVKLVLDSFEEDTFKMDDVVPQQLSHERAEKVMARIIETARRVTEVLTPEQRKVAADKIRDKVRGGGYGEEGTGRTTAHLESSDTTSEPLWVGGSRGFATGYRSASSFGFSRGFSAGWGGGWMW